MIKWLKHLFSKGRRELAEQRDEGVRKGVELAAETSKQVQAVAEGTFEGLAELRFQHSDGHWVSIPVTGEIVTIGRDESCEIRIDENYPHYETVSGRHAQVERWRSMWIIKDLTGKGIFINGRRTGENVLRNGYRVKLGELEFEFREGAKLTNRL